PRSATRILHLMRRGPHKGSRGSGDGAAGSGPTQVFRPFITPTRRQWKSLGKSFDHCSGTVAPEAPGYSTKELAPETLPDFERLFEKRPAPGAYVCWCLYHHRDPSQAIRKRSISRVEEAKRKRRQKRELVANGRSHGILVYSDGDPVGWCQYGSMEELPRIDSNPSYRRLDPGGDAGRGGRSDWLVVDKIRRKRGGGEGGSMS